MHNNASVAANNAKSPLDVDEAVIVVVNGGFDAPTATSATVATSIAPVARTASLLTNEKDRSSQRNSTYVAASPPSMQSARVISSSRGGGKAPSTLGGAVYPLSMPMAGLNAAHTPTATTSSSPQQQHQPKKSKCLSITCLSVVFATILITMTVGVVLSVSVVYSLRAADSFAETFSRANLIAARNKINDFVAIPLNAHTEIATATRYGYLPNIVNGTAFTSILPFVNNNTNATAVAQHNAVRSEMYQEWKALFHGILFGTNFKILYVGTGLADRSWIACNLDANDGTYPNSCYSNDPQNLTTPFYFISKEFTNPLSPDPSLRGVTQSFGIMGYDPTQRPWYISGPQRLGDKPVFSDIYIDVGLGVPIVDVNGPLFTPEGAFLGITSLSLDLKQISEFLADLPRTDKSLTVLLDGGGFVLGASDKGALSVSLPYDPSKGDTLGPGCDQYTDEATLAVSQTCRRTPLTYGHPTLAALYTEHSSGDGGFFSSTHDDTFTRRVQIGGEQWMVSKAPIEARAPIAEGVIRWQMVTLMPVADVTGQIVDGRNIGILIACLMVAASCGACGAMLYALLLPLSTLANQLRDASELKDDALTAANASGGEKHHKSRLREIRTIQDAYERLSSQLGRAKSFLPASLLAQLEADEDDDDDEEEDAEDGCDGGGNGDRSDGDVDMDTLMSSESNKTSARNTSKSNERRTNHSSTDNNYHNHTHTTVTVTPASDGGSLLVGINGKRRLDQRGSGRRREGNNKFLDTQSSRSYRSAQGGAASAAASHLDGDASSPLRIISTHGGLASKTVTIAVLNLRNFHHHFFFGGGARPARPTATPTPSALSPSPLLLSSSSIHNLPYADLIDALQAIAKEGRGILDSFHGDRFVFTFNAARPCSAHASMAATAMLKATAHVAKVMPLMTMPTGGNATTMKPIANSGTRAADKDKGWSCVGMTSQATTCGVATGRCFVGNMGSDRARRFTIVGPAYTYATVLERLCKRYAVNSRHTNPTKADTNTNTTDTNRAAAVVSVLMSEETACEAETHVGLLAVDLISAPHTATASGVGVGGGGGMSNHAFGGAKNTDDDVRGEFGRPSIVYAGMYLRTNGYQNNNKLATATGNNKDDEWMYALAHATQSCPYSAGNLAFTEAVAGDVETAAENLKNFTDPSPQSRMARRRILEMIHDQKTKQKREEEEEAAAALVLAAVVSRTSSSSSLPPTLTGGAAAGKKTTSKTAPVEAVSVPLLIVPSSRVGGGGGATGSGGRSGGCVGSASHGPRRTTASPTELGRFYDECILGMPPQPRHRASQEERAAAAAEEKEEGEEDASSASHFAPVEVVTSGTEDTATTEEPRARVP